MAFDLDAQTKKFADLRRKWRDEKDAIDKEPHLTPDGKRAKKAEAHKAILAQHRDLKTQFKAEIAAERDRLKRAAFSPTTSSDMATHRQIVSEAAAADQKARRRLLERAQLSGDRAAQKAVLAAAVEVGDFELVHSAGDSVAKEFAQFERTYGDSPDPATHISISMAVTAPSL